MKVILTTLAILMISFLSDRIRITIVKSTELSVTVGLTLFSIFFYPDGGRSVNPKGLLSNLRPAIRAIRYLLLRSRVMFTVRRASSGAYLPLSDLATSVQLLSDGKRHKFKESFDPSLTSDEISFSISTDVIILLFSLILFVYYKAVNAIKRGIKNVG